MGEGWGQRSGARGSCFPSLWLSGAQSTQNLYGSISLGIHMVGSFVSVSISASLYSVIIISKVGALTICKYYVEVRSLTIHENFSTLFLSFPAGPTAPSWFLREQLHVGALSHAPSSGLGATPRGGGGLRVSEGPARPHLTRELRHHAPRGQGVLGLGVLLLAAQLAVQPLAVPEAAQRSHALQDVGVQLSV